MDQASSALPNARSPREILPAALIEQLQAQPWRYGFFALMRRLNANPAVAPVGTARLPGADPFRVGQKPSLIFAPREIAEAKLKDGKLHIRLYGLGMAGPNGPLPIHVTEIAREREELRQDPTLSNFLDIFHHRSLTLLYRAWARSQSTANLDRLEHDRFSVYVATLSGHRQRRDRRWPLPAHVHLSAAPHLVRQPRNVDGLRSMIAYHFGVPVRIEENVFQWMSIESEELCRMGKERMSSYMGSGAVLGEQMPDRLYRFQIVIGPLDIEAYHGFTPRGSNLLRLIECVRAFIGKQYNWELKLLIKPRSATPAVMGGPEQLGWSSWLGQSPTDEPVVGMRFEPELYLRQLRESAAKRTKRAEGGSE